MNLIKSVNGHKVELVTARTWSDSVLMLAENVLINKFGSETKHGENQTI